MSLSYIPGGQTCLRKAGICSFLLLLSCLSCSTQQAATASITTGQANRPTTKQAYVTLLYGESYVLGVRVLGQSLREAGTTRDMVVLATGPLSASAEMTLMMDGWKVKRVNPVFNPGKGPQREGFPKKFWAVYTKLLVFQLVEYTKVVFLDSDTVAIRNPDSLFSCPGFCACLRHSERFNSGVMVLTPSNEMYEDMMLQISSLPSYTGGDQGFLNAYFSGFAHSPLFDPAAQYTPDQYKYMRLPTSFNADAGLFIINNNRWMIPRDSLHIMHFTLGNFKPWAWYTSWLITETHVWQEFRAKLPADSSGMVNGVTHRQSFAQRWLSLLPLLALPLLCSGASGGRCWGGRGGLSSSLDAILMHSNAGALLSPSSSSRRADSLLGGVVGSGFRSHLPAGALFIPTAVGAGLGSLLLGAGVALLVVPPEVTPFWGWLLSYEWALLAFFALYGRFLCTCYRWGKESSGMQGSNPKPGAYQQPWLETLLSALAFAALAIAAPWVADMLGLSHVLMLKILLTIATGVVAALLAIVQFVLLPVLWVQAGRVEARFE